MNIRGWLLAMAAAVALGGTYAHAATTPGDFIPSGGASVSPVQQEAAVNALARTGVDSSAAHTALIGGSKGTFMNAASRVINAGGSQGVAMQNIMNATGGDALVGIRIASGQTTLATANAATATINSVAGPGGVMQQRFATLTAERRATVDRFGSDSAMASAYMNQNYMNRLWVSPFYTYQDMGDKDGYAAYDYKAWGGSIGYDRAFGPITLGAAFTYSRGDYDEKGVNDDNTIDNYGVSLYANYYHSSGFFGTVYGGYNYADNDMKAFEPVNRAWQRGENHTNSWWLGGTLGYDFRVTNCFTLTPSAGLLWSDSKGSEYTMHGPITARVGKIKNQGLLLPVDLAATYTARLDNVSSVQFKVSGGYAYNFKNDGAEGRMNYGNSAVLIQGVKPGRNSWNVGAGIKYTRDKFDIGVDYRYDGKKKYDGHRVSATIGISF